MKKDFSSVRLCVLISSGFSPLPLGRLTREVVLGGADCVQLRLKGISDREFLEIALECRRAAGEALFIVNDRPDIAALSGADGVHVGQDDLPGRAVRQIIGDEALLGISTANAAQLAQAEDAGADYLGVGCVFPTTTKEIAVEGLEYVEEASRLTGLPFLAIGGINLENVGRVIRAGAPGVAVCSAIIADEDPQKAAAELKEAILSAIA